MVHIAQALFLCVYYNLDDRGPRPRTNPYIESELSFICTNPCLLAKCSVKRRTLASSRMLPSGTEACNSTTPATLILNL